MATAASAIKVPQERRDTQSMAVQMSHDDLLSLAEDIKKLQDLRDEIVLGLHAFYTAPGVEGRPPLVEAPPPVETSSIALLQRISHPDITKAGKNSIENQVNHLETHGKDFTAREATAAAPSSNQGVRRREAYGRSRSPNRPVNDKRSTGRSTRIPSTAPPYSERSFDLERRDKPPSIFGEKSSRTASDSRRRQASPVRFPRRNHRSRSPDPRVRNDRFAKQRRSPSPTGSSQCTGGVARDNKAQSYSARQSSHTKQDIDSRTRQSQVSPEPQLFRPPITIAGAADRLTFASQQPSTSMTDDSTFTKSAPATQNSFANDASARDSSWAVSQEQSGGAGTWAPQSDGHQTWPEQLDVYPSTFQATTPGMSLPGESFQNFQQTLYPYAISRQPTRTPNYPQFGYPQIPQHWLAGAGQASAYYTQSYYTGQDARYDM